MKLSMHSTEAAYWVKQTWRFRLWAWWNNAEVPRDLIATIIQDDIDPESSTRSDEDREAFAARLAGSYGFPVVIIISLISIVLTLYRIWLERRK